MAGLDVLGQPLDEDHVCRAALVAELCVWAVRVVQHTHRHIHTDTRTHTHTHARTHIYTPHIRTQTHTHIHMRAPRWCPGRTRNGCCHDDDAIGRYATSRLTLTWFAPSVACTHSFIHAFVRPHSLVRCRCELGTPVAEEMVAAALADPRVWKVPPPPLSVGNLLPRPPPPPPSSERADALLPSPPSAAVLGLPSEAAVAPAVSAEGRAPPSSSPSAVWLGGGEGGGGGGGGGSGGGGSGGVGDGDDPRSSIAMAVDYIVCLSKADTADRMRQARVRASCVVGT